MTDRDPLPLSSVLSVLAAIAAVALVATATTQRSALFVAVVGLVGLGVGGRLARRRHRLLGGVLVAGGVAAVLLAFSRGASGPMGLQAELLPGLVGLALLTLGLAPVRRGWERPLVSGGTGAVLVTVVVSGIVRSAGTATLLLAGVATVVAWDLGEQAVNVSGHVGTDARTWPVELAHGGVGLLVGAVGVVVALFVTDFQVTALPVAGLGVLLGATVVLTTALYN